jgi:hypothetical protein
VGAGVEGIRLDLEEVEGALIRLAILLFALALGPSCASERAGWGSRGKYWVLYESPSLQVRRGAQRVDPRTGEIVIAWVGARAPEGQPALVDCELTVFDDQDADGVPDPAEIRSVRASGERSRKLLFGDVRARLAGARNLCVRLVASTERERCTVGWRLASD